MAQLLIKLLRVRDVSEEGAGQSCQLPNNVLVCGLRPYNCATRPELVEMEDWLKAGHWVDPDSGMQFSAMAKGVATRTVTTMDENVDGCLRFGRTRLARAVEEDSVLIGRADPTCIVLRGGLHRCTSFSGRRRCSASSCSPATSIETRSGGRWSAVSVPLQVPTGSLARSLGQPYRVKVLAV